MCEHNLVIGERYQIDGGINTCTGCNQSHANGSLPVIYMGDRGLNVHVFTRVTPAPCPYNCGQMLTTLDMFCRSGGPIDVTQEFLSLPVRSRE